MALTDADRLQMTAMALMRYSVITRYASPSLVGQPKYAIGWPPNLFPFNENNERLLVNDYVAVGYNYTIT